MKHAPKNQRKPRPNTRWQTIGIAAVDSGTLMIADPCHADDQADLGALEKYDSCQLGDASGVAVRTVYGDGFFAVEGRYKDGVLVEIRVRLD